MKLVRQAVIAILLILFILDSIVMVSALSPCAESTREDEQISLHEIQLLFNVLAEEQEETDDSDEEAFGDPVDVIVPILPVVDLRLASGLGLHPSRRSVPLYSYHCTYLI